MSKIVILNQIICMFLYVFLWTGMAESADSEPVEGEVCNESLFPKGVKNIAIEASEDLSDELIQQAQWEGEKISSSLVTALLSNNGKIDFYDTSMSIGNEAERRTAALRNNPILKKSLATFNGNTRDLNVEVAENLDQLLDQLRLFQNGRQSLRQRTRSLSKIPFIGEKVIRPLRQRVESAKAAVDEIIQSLKKHRLALEQNNKSLKFAIRDSITILKALKYSILVSEAIDNSIVQTLQKDELPHSIIDQLEEARKLVGIRLEDLNSIQLSLVTYIQVFEKKQDHNRQGVLHVNRSLGVSVPVIELSAISDGSTETLDRTLKTGDALRNFANNQILRTTNDIVRQGEMLREREQQQLLSSEPLRIAVETVAQESDKYRRHNKDMIRKIRQVINENTEALQAAERLRLEQTPLSR
ncbi:MAG: toxic anion resistance protein [Bdellovibrionales bacterium]|nr:toxic anion resistance protein [Bdellovibrionales bacterium]